MTALATERDTKHRETNAIRSLPVAAATTIYAGSLVCFNAAGHAVPGSASGLLKAAGRAEESVDNSAGAAAAKNVKVRSGIFRFANSASTDAIAITARDRLCYVQDDQTVALTDNAGARPVAGRIDDVDSSGVWVEILGRAKPCVPVTVRIADVSTADTEYVRSPVAGRVVKVQTTLKNAITVADSAVTTSIDGVAITGGALTIAFTGSGAGTLDEVAPTALNVVTAGGLLSAATDGASTTAAPLYVTFFIEPT